MNTTPLLTVAIPFLNSGGKLRWAIESVLRQTYQDWELLLIDDGSGHSDVQIANEYAGEPRIRYIRDGRTLGLAPRLNFISEIARGKYLARMDADDIMHPERLSEQVAYLDANPDIDIVGTDVYFIDNDMNIRGRGRTPVRRLCSRLSYTGFFHPTITGRRDWFLKNPYSHEFLRCEDVELWIRTASEIRAAVIEKPLFFYNRWAFQGAKNRRSLRQYQQILKLHKTRLCAFCLMREVATAEAKRAMYLAVDLLGVVDWYLQFAIAPVGATELRSAQAFLREMSNPATLRAQRPGTATAARKSPASITSAATEGGPGVSVAYGEYGATAPYNPPADAPELRRFKAGEGPGNGMVYPLRRIFLANGLDRENFGSADWNPLGRWIKPGMKIAVKPNWVRHEWGALVGQEALCTHSSLIRALIDYCLIALKGEGRISVVDAPLQGADFEAIVKQQSIDSLREHYAGSPVPVQFFDLRFEWAQLLDGTGYIKERRPLAGDPAGYSINDLKERSRLTGLNCSAPLAVGDYDSNVTNQHHLAGRHEYCISNTVLESDVLLNIPKLKTHVKAGVTGGLKNFIGINCSKDYLPHYRIGAPKAGGDEFPDGKPVSALVGKLRPRLQSRIHPWLWRLSRNLATLRPIVQGGGWPGNDTLWRTIYDVNRIARWYASGGVERDTPRPILTFVDAIVAGEGEGPLRPTPTRRNLVFFGESPGAVDYAAAEMMGFDPAAIPLLRHLTDEESRDIAQFSGKARFTMDERTQEGRGDGKPFAGPRSWSPLMPTLDSIPG